MSEEADILDGLKYVRKTPVEELHTADIIDLQHASPDQIRDLVLESKAVGNDGLAYFALGVLALRAHQQPTAGMTIRGKFWGSEQQRQDRKLQTQDRNNALQIVGEFLPHIVPDKPIQRVEDTPSSIKVETHVSELGLGLNDY